MKLKSMLLFGSLLLCLLMVNTVDGQKLVKDFDVSPAEAKIQLTNKAKGYLIEIGGPNNYYWNTQVKDAQEVKLTNKRANGELFEDGSYTLQVTPIYELTAAQRAELQPLRMANDVAGIAAFRAKNNLPEMVNVYNINFGIRNGQFLNPKQKESKLPTISSTWTQDHPSLYASLSTIVTNLPSTLAKDNTPAKGMEDAQVIATDLIVQGSSCVGIDCASSESFGFDTGRYKENNLRLHFDDTSSSASFPSNDWRITINDSSNGGSSYFAVEDATANTIPLRVMAGAGNNALYISNSGGNVGMGTASPVVELHVADGDSPTLRLEQNGSNGWTPQIWDVAGNETNFFVRDVTNSSKLPFKIRPGAPDNSLYVQNNGNIGLGNASPSERLHLQTGNIKLDAGSVILGSGGMTLAEGDFEVTSGDVTFGEGDISIPEGQLGIGKTPTSTLDVEGISKFNGNFQVTGTSTFRGNISAQNSANTGTVFHVDHTNTRVGIGKNNPDHLLELSGDDAVKPNGGSWSGPSDRRLKTDISNFTDGLSSIMKIRPVNYRYNGKMGLPTNENFVGVIAQEVQEIAPYMIKPLNPSAKVGEEKYLAVNNGAMTYMLINAVQEQQQIIEAQQAEIDALNGQLADLDALKAQVAALAELVQTGESATEAVETIGEDRD